MRQLAVLMLVCRVCGNTAAQQLWKRATKFSLFFIPLFSVRTRYLMGCGFCGSEYAVSRAEARRLGA
jgi:hypothetical protein